MTEDERLAMLEIRSLIAGEIKQIRRELAEIRAALDMDYDAVMDEGEIC